MSRSIGRKRAAGTVAVLVALAFVAGACGGNDTAEPETEVGDVEVTSQGPAQAGGALVIARAVETSGWDPTSDQWAGSSAYTVANAIFDPLMAYDENYEPQPYLLESIESDDTFVEWTLKLREGIEFTNGEPADAAAMIANFTAHQSSIVTSAAAQNIVGMEVVDPLTVRLTMEEPWSTFPHWLTIQPGYLAAPEMLDAEDGSANPIGTGPFMLDEWVRDDTLTVNKNPNYWREGYPLLDRIEFPVILDSTSRANSVSNGDIDMTEYSTASIEQVLNTKDDAEAGEVQIYSDEAGETTDTFIMLNTSKPPFNEPSCRETMATALDTESLSLDVFSGLAPAARGMFKPESPWYVETDYPTYDPARAQELLDECAAAIGGVPTFEVLIPPGNDVLSIAQYLQQQGDAIGVQVELVTREQTAFIIEVLTKDYTAAAFRIPFFTHPDLLAPFLLSSGVKDAPEFALNATQVENPAIDAAFAAARATDDVEEQRAQYAIVQREVNEDMARIWLMHDIEVIAARNGVRDTTTWEFPDGTPGLGQIAATIQVHQLWVEGDE
jgi:peptide/nickel transport system substrate-binding protein